MRKILVALALAAAACESADSGQGGAGSYAPDLGMSTDSESTLAPLDMRPCGGVYHIYVDNRSRTDRKVPGDGSPAAPLFTTEEVLALARSGACGEGPSTQWYLHLVRSPVPYGPLYLPPGPRVQLLVDSVTGEGDRVTLAAPSFAPREAPIHSVVQMETTGALQMTDVWLRGGNFGLWCKGPNKDRLDSSVVLENVRIEQSSAGFAAEDCELLMRGGSVANTWGLSRFQGRSRYALQGVYFFDNALAGSLLGFYDKSFGTAHALDMRGNTTFAGRPLVSCRATDKTHFDTGVLIHKKPWYDGTCVFGENYVLGEP